MAKPGCRPPSQREFFIDNLLVRINFIFVMIRWTCLAPWEFEFLFQVEMCLTAHVVSLDTANKTVELSDGRTISFGR